MTMEESDRRTLPAIAASGQEADVPLIAGTPWDMIQADFSAMTKPDVIVFKGMHGIMPL
ncbi:hypothetical protein [Mesorhizobium sp. ES1-1]|uniref:hypothetical protein n=1 Tax=Mesorhizobium sp. ES1-1 TaxID=2876629 RepID=UPI001CCA6DC7|nr:hypothetical protein [Mesorhizobium sp. ES1-1]MBZ9676638.1 hypothetical protein [Mesorhizobium sp. ES1-1]